jgi:hypothetical protein
LNIWKLKLIVKLWSSQLNKSENEFKLKQNVEV